MSVCDLPGVASVCNAIGEGAADAATVPFEWLADGLGSLAGWLFENVWTLFATTTAVDLTNPTYLRSYSAVFGVAVFLMVGLFLAQLIAGMVRRDPTSLSTAALGLGKAVLGSFLVVTLTATALQIVDQLCVGIVQATGTTLDQMGERIAVLGGTFATVATLVPGAGVLLAIFLGSMAVGAALCVWCSLLLRKALILVAVVLAPIALSGQSWRATRAWTSRWATFVVALIASKLVMVVVFLVAINQMDSPIDLDLASISDPIAGVVLMVVAGFAPYLTYKLIAFVGFDLHQVMSTEAEARSAIDRPLPVPAAGWGLRSILHGPADQPDRARPSGSSTVPAGDVSPSPQPAAPMSDVPAGAAADGPGTAGTAGSAAGADTADGGAAAGGAAAAAGPVGLAAAAAVSAAQGAAEAGPAVGQQLAGQSDQIAQAAPDQQPPAPASPPTPAPNPPTPPTSDPPSQPPGD